MQRRHILSVLVACLICTEIAPADDHGYDYPFDLTDLRALDTRLASACLDYLNYDRLSKHEVHRHLSNGERELHQWIEDYAVEPCRPPAAL